jgi:hypothetical protein
MVVETVMQNAGKISDFAFRWRISLATFALSADEEL